MSQNGQNTTGSGRIVKSGTGVKTAAGPGASALKYDILTALGTYACQAGKHEARLVLRVMTLLVARYSWTKNEIAVGQRELAALWSVDERTVKRDMARLRDLGWILCERPAARGRVATYRLGLAKILGATQAVWGNVGPDFVQRMTVETMGALPGAPPVSGPQDGGNVIAFPAAQGHSGATTAEREIWAQIQTRLHREDPHLYQAWFAGLVALSFDDGVLDLAAPTRFHATYILTNHAQRLTRLGMGVDPTLRKVTVQG